MKKVVLRVVLRDEKFKQKIMKCVCGVTGVVSIAVDMEENKLTVIGNIDSYALESKLRKICDTETISEVEVRSGGASSVGGKPLAPSIRRKNNDPCTIL